MMLVREAVVGFHLLGCTRDGRFDITRLVADESLFRRQPFLEHLIDALAGETRIRASIPFDGKGIESRLGTPPRVGDDRDGIVADGNDLLDPGHALSLCGIEALERSEEHTSELQS